MRKTSVVGTASALNGSDVATRTAIVARTIASVYARPRTASRKAGTGPQAEPADAARRRAPRSQAIASRASDPSAAVPADSRTR
jgi:hypothetical protein